MTKKTFQRPGIVIQLAEKKEGEKTEKIQIFKAGTFYHAYYGEFVLTSAMFMAMVQNFKDRVYDVDLMIDYDHEVREAAAWVKSIFLGEDSESLWAEVEWTPEGARCVGEKEYRYISGDFSFNYIDNERNLDFGPVLFGAALTNRPFLKGMAPTTELNDFTGGNHMTLQQLQDENKKLAEQVKAIQTEKESEVKRLSDEITKKDSELKALKEKEEKALADAAIAKKEQEFTVMLSQKKAVPAQKEAYMKGDLAKFIELGAQLHEKPEGSTEEPEAPAADEEKEAKVMKLAEEKVAKGGISMADAISEALKEVK